MYSNEKKGFSILDLIVKIIFAGLFIFILVWLFQKKVPNMTPFYSNVFRENIKYMQEAGESYFTDDKMPIEVGDETKISLSEMYDKNLIIPFVDEDGNSCNQYDSYVAMTKTVTGYELKTNLVCNKESNYTIKTLGCHTYCPNNNCAKTCSVANIEKITKYQYKKLVTGTKTTYSCPSGYKLKNKNCYKTVKTDTKPATSTQECTTVKTMAAVVKFIGGTKQSLTPIVNSKKIYDGKVVEGTKKVYTEANKKYVEASTTTKQVAYTCQKTKTERKCSTTYQTYSYSCNCTGSWSHGQYVSSCSTCSGSTPVESCSNVSVPYNDTCYRTETVNIPASTQYSCPAGYTEEGSGSSLKCYKNEKTYSCPAGYIPEGSGSSLKCYRTEKTYSCPAEANVVSGEGKDIKCYKSEKGTYTYECSDKSYTLDGRVCKKTVKESSSKLTCSKGYTLDGKKCYKTSTTKKKATAKKVTTKSYKYTWSKKESLSGWTRTGKTKTVDVKTKASC